MVWNGNPILIALKDKKVENVNVKLSALVKDSSCHDECEFQQVNEYLVNTKMTSACFAHLPQRIVKQSDIYYYERWGKFMLKVKQEIKIIDSLEVIDIYTITAIVLIIVIEIWIWKLKKSRTHQKIQNEET